MSHGSSGNQVAYTNYQPCHLKAARLLDISSRNLFSSPRCLDMDNRTCSARTSLSVGEEPLQSCRDDIHSILSGCGSQVGAPYFTKYLESKIAKIQEQRQKALSENMQLNNQLSRATARNRQLEEKASSLEEALLKEKRQHQLAITSHQEPSTASMHNQGVSATRTFSDASTSMEYPLSRLECAVQTLSSGEGGDAIVPMGLVSISKSELASLENDVKTLREAVRAKEEMWEQTMERERNYREHWARLSRELITVRQQLDSRDTELKTLEKKLADKTEELRAVQKELSFTKKKSQKSQRDSAGSNQGLSTPDYLGSRETQHYKLTEAKHESPRQSPLAKSRSTKMSPTKDVRGLQRHSSRDHYGVSPRLELPTFAQVK